MSDEPARDLIAQAAAGSRPALERLLLAHYGSIAVHISSRLPAWVERVISVEDILQETFSQAFRDIIRFVPSSEQAFLAWVKTIAENRLLDTIKGLRRRKRGGDHRQVSCVVGTTASSVADLFDLIPAADNTPSRSLKRREAAQAIQVALAGLSEDHRNVIRLRYLEGKSVEQIANIMHRSAEAVRGLIHRAKEAMRTSLGRSSLYLSSR